VDADATRAESIADQVAGLGRDESRRRGEQALEQVLDAAVEDKGVVIRRETPSVAAADVVPAASSGEDLNLINCRGWLGRYEAQSPGGATHRTLVVA